MVMSMTRPRRSFGLPCKLVDRDAYDWLTDDYMAKVRGSGDDRERMSCTHHWRGTWPICDRARPEAPIPVYSSSFVNLVSAPVDLAWGKLDISSPNKVKEGSQEARPAHQIQ